MSRKQQGFTLVELMLSMAFVSVLLIAISFMIIQMSAIYNRGETLRQVNQASRLLTDNFQQTIGEAAPSSIDVSKVGSHGRLCTGKYSYIWSGLNPDGTNKYPNNRYAGSAPEQIRLVRVVDTGGLYCTQNGGNLQINRATAAPIELLAEGDRSLLVHRMTVVPSMTGSATGQQLYMISILVGTESIEEIDTGAGSCLPPAELDGTQSYCAVNQLNLTVRAGIG